MKPRMGNRLGVEALEDRCVPAVVASIRFGVLTVSGSPGGAVEITQTAAGQFSVTDDGAAVTIKGSGTVRNVFVRLGSVNDDVTIDLGGETLGGGVTAWLGGGDNTLAVRNGTIGRALTVLADSGGDTVALEADLTVNGPTSVALNGGDDTLTADATLASFLTVAGANQVSLGGSVDRWASFVSDSAGGNVTVSGSVNGLLSFSAGFLGLFGGGPNSLTLEAGAEVGGLIYKGALFGSSADAVTIEDGVTIAGSVWVSTGGGNDVVTLGAATVGGSATFLLGAGNDSLTDTGLVVAGTQFADGGPGTDTFTGDDSLWTLVSFE